jgi:hypothetical protein
MTESKNFSFTKNILSLNNPDSIVFALNTDLLDSILTDLSGSIVKTIKQNPALRDDIFDSFSANQLVSKEALLKSINDLNILDTNSIVIIWGSWYGSILIPSLSKKVKKIIAIDLDDTTVQIGKRFFRHYKNVEFRCANVFENYLNFYKNANLIINTSCEHMPSMKQWKWFGPGAIEEDTFKGLKGEGFKSPKLSSNCYFAFQSNNMFDIKGHINCVNNLEEFKDQMPLRAKILFEDEVDDLRGTRYMLVGKFVSL